MTGTLRSPPEAEEGQTCVVEREGEVSERGNGMEQRTRSRGVAHVRYFVLGGDVFASSRSCTERSDRSR